MKRKVKVTAKMLPEVMHSYQYTNYMHARPIYLYRELLFTIRVEKRVLCLLDVIQITEILLTI